MEKALFLLLIYAFGVFVALVFTLLEYDSNHIIPNYDKMWLSWYTVIKLLMKYF